MDINLVQAIKRNHPVVFFDVAVGGIPLGRIKFELFSDICPKTAENFRQFCTGEFKKGHIPIGYKNSRFHRIIKNFIIQGGDFIKGDGSGAISIYGVTFPDENFEIKHTQAGLLAMANNGANHNGCQFYITCAPTPTLDDKYVVFGKVLDQESMAIIRQIENVPTEANDVPTKSVTIIECGEL